MDNPTRAEVFGTDETRELPIVGEVIVPIRADTDGHIVIDFMAARFNLPAGYVMRTHEELNRTATTIYPPSKGKNK